MNQVVFYALVHMLHPGVQRASSNIVMGTGLAAACAVSSAAASVCCEKSSWTLHAVDLSTKLGTGSCLGFWAPLDLNKYADPDADAFQFKYHRVNELQHGLISMLLCTGCIVPEYCK